jgi:hypothetical protein
MESFKPIGTIAARVAERVKPEVAELRYPSVAHGLAYLMARRAIARQLQAQGLRRWRYADIIEQARA